MSLGICRRHHFILLKDPSLDIRRSCQGICQRHHHRRDRFRPSLSTQPKTARKRHDPFHKCYSLCE
jgi:hypothetical protein